MRRRAEDPASKYCKSNVFNFEFLYVLCGLASKENSFARPISHRVIAGSGRWRRAETQLLTCSHAYMLFWRAHAGFTVEG